MSSKNGHYGASTQQGAKNLHHLCWMRREWSKNEVAAKLRNHPYCIVQIKQDTLHRYIHEHMRSIPIPRECSIEHALEQLELLKRCKGISDTDTLEKRLTILQALFECSDPMTASAFSNQLELVRKYNKKTPR